MLELVKALNHRGNHLEGWTRWRWRRRAAEAFQSISVPVYPLLSTGRITDPVLPSLYSIAGKLDAIHSPNGLLLPFTGRTPQTVMVHDLAFLLFPETKPDDEVIRWRNKLAGIVSRADGIMVNSLTTANDLKELFPETSSRIFITKLGIDHFRKHHAVKITSGKHILAVGTVEPRKNYKTLFRAYETAAAELPDIPDLVVAGGMGYRSNEILSAARSSSVNKKIHFTGFISDENLKKLYTEAFCLVHTAVYEGFGFTVPEALGFGLPVVCSRNSALFELFGEAVYLVDSGNHDSIAHGLISALQNGVSKKQAKAVEHLFRTLTWNKCAENTENAFKAIT
jgi:alpha-1,3-rhamnosyl/mannosyltransferase